MNQTTCVLCNQSRKTKKFKPLYGTPVCRKCYYAFANRRQVGYLIDYVLWFPISMMLVTAASEAMLMANVAPDTADITTVILAWLAFPLLFFFKDGLSGHSPGKFLMGVRVVHKETYQPMGLLASFKRNLILIVPFMPLVVAILLPAGPRLGDGWAKTKVIWKRFADHPVFSGRLSCTRCQFDLRGNQSGVCPECGSPFQVDFAPPVRA